MLKVQKHKIIMTKILKDIYSRIEISSDLIFKGGTACFLFYGLNRFSTDLDFDLLNPNNKDTVRAELNKILENYGRLTDQADKKYTLLFELSYSEGERRLKIEVSKRPTNSQARILNYLGIPMKVMVKENIFANKLLALTSRKNTATRDIFDLYFFFRENWDINKTIIKEQTNKSLSEYLKDCLNTVEKFSNRNILFGLGDLVEEKQKAWIKNNLKNDLIFLIKSHLQ